MRSPAPLARRAWRCGRGRGCSPSKARGRDARSGARALAASLVRLATYSDDLGELSAEVGLAQLQQALSRGVMYLDGGWQSLVDALAGAAREAGVEVRTGAGVQSIEGAGAGR